jgi:hypothetical protein
MGAGGDKAAMSKQLLPDAVWEVLTEHREIAYRSGYEAGFKARDAEVEKFRSALKAITSCPDGKSLTWPEIDQLVREALGEK